MGADEHGGRLLLKREGAPESKAHRKICRPWGSYDGITEGERWQPKTIVVKGTAVVEKGGHQELLGENQSMYTPLGCRHRLSNSGTIPVELIEVQRGPYLGEDDIVRFEGRYGRLDAKITISAALA